MQDVTGNFENVYYKKVTDIEKYILHAIKLLNYLLLYYEIPLDKNPLQIC